MLITKKVLMKLILNLNASLSCIFIDYEDLIEV